jgi:hypothetical protein
MEPFESFCTLERDFAAGMKKYLTALSFNDRSVWFYSDLLSFTSLATIIIVFRFNKGQTEYLNMDAFFLFHELPREQYTLRYTSNSGNP